MKNTKFFLTLSILICFSSVCYGENLNTLHKTGSTLKWTPVSADSVSAKANANSGYGSSSPSMFQDPLVNGALNGYYNMMQGMSGNPYNMQEQQKQQADYVRQQTVNVDKGE